MDPVGETIGVAGQARVARDHCAMLMPGISVGASCRVATILPISRSLLLIPVGMGAKVSISWFVEPARPRVPCGHPAGAARFGKCDQPGQTGTCSVPGTNPCAVRHAHHRRGPRPGRTQGRPGVARPLQGPPQQIHVVVIAQPKAKFLLASLYGQTSVATIHS